MNRIRGESLTFDDVLLIPAHSTVQPATANLATKLTSKISLNIPLVSAAMDTVTESKLAIALAQEGGIGFIHKNTNPEFQIEEVKRVKKYESGIVLDPITVTPDLTQNEVRKLVKENGFAGFPVVEKGTKNLIGIITNRDVRFVKNLDQSVDTVMTPKEKLVTAMINETRDNILHLLHENRLEKLLLVDEKYQLVGLVTVKDFQKAESKPNASRDTTGKLIVGAAVGVSQEDDIQIDNLVKSNVDVILIDSSHGHSNNVIECVRRTRKRHPNLQIIAGNVATSEGAIALVEAGADAVKVGIGPGSICTTRVVTGVGVPQITAIMSVAEALKDKGIPIIADGGIRYSGDIAKAIAAGASTVMVGSLFAGTEEAPGELELYQGRTFKHYRGMGSLGAMVKGSSDRYFQSRNAADKLVPEGIEGRVPYRGKLEDLIFQLMGGLRSCMGLTNSSTIEHLRTKTEFYRITTAGIRESHVHDVIITKEPPNYFIKD